MAANDFLAPGGMPTSTASSPAMSKSNSATSLHSAQSDIGDKVDVAEIESSVTTVQVPAEDNASKFQIILGLLKKMIGVKDIVGMRISLPAQLLDPISNLEYWTYMDRPDYFSAISDPDDPVERMAAVVRWYLSKDLKFVKNRLVKPYNSILGEQFMAHLDAEAAPPAFSGKTQPEGPKRRVTMSIEQISHHPPVSAFLYECADKGIVARGVDHICAKFTGTSVRVAPGKDNHGIFVVLRQRDDEEYACTHPTAYINGWLRGSLYVSVSEVTVITCEKTGLQAVLEYKEEKWFAKTKNAIEGRIFKLKGPAPTPSLTQLGKSASKSSLKKKRQSVASLDGDLSSPVTEHKPHWTEHLGGMEMKDAFDPNREGETVATITGSWRAEMSIQRGNGKPVPFLDMQNIEVAPKEVRPLSEQGPNESRNIWREVTDAIKRKEYSKATNLKHALEDAQRARAQKRKEENAPFVSELFLPVKLWGRPGVPVAKKEVEEQRSYLPKAATEGHSEFADATDAGDGAVEAVGQV